jgi:RHS repeat-associated protein
MNDASGQTLYSYDNRERLSSKQTPFGTLSYTYDGAGNLQTTRSSNPNGASVNYSYDALNRLATVKDNNLLALNGGLTSYVYDGAGNLQSYQSPNGVTSSYAYNSLNRLTTMNLKLGAVPLASYGYTLDAAGNRTAVTELSGRTVNFTYDDLYRLTDESITSDSQSVNGNIGYSYDAVGNRLNRTSTVAPVSSQASSYDANDRLTSDTYDNNGNTLSADGNSYAYDFENHLVSRNAGAGQYLYDGDGNLVAKTESGFTTNYLVDDNNPTGYAQVVEELQGNAVTRQFTYGLTRISQRIIGGQLSFYGYDGHGSVRTLTDASGSVTDAYTYDAFGNLLSSTGTTPNDYRSCGERFDGNLGFYHLRARFMNPAAGRFITMDTFEGSNSDPLTLHKYLYARANPVRNVDPSGRASLVEEEIVIADAGILDSMSALGQAALRHLLTNRLTTGVLGSLTWIFRNPETVRELEEDGEEGIVKVQEAFLKSEEVVSEAEAEASSIWNNFDSLKKAFNELFSSNPGRNPTDVEYHHLVEQNATNAEQFSEKAINSWANVVPTPTSIHRVISGFYSSGSRSVQWLPEEFSTVRQWMQTQDWETQYRAGLEIWKQAMAGGGITWAP